MSERPGKQKLEELVAKVASFQGWFDVLVTADTIRSISDAYKAMEAENERLRALIAAGDDAHRSIVKEADESDYYRPGESGYSRADEEWFFDMDGKP